MTVHYSGVLFSYIGGLAGAKARCLLDGGVHYLECPLKEVPLYCHKEPRNLNLQLPEDNS